jgi:hypothetical protein
MVLLGVAAGDAALQVGDVAVVVEQGKAGDAAGAAALRQIRCGLKVESAAGELVLVASCWSGTK